MTSSRRGFTSPLRARRIAAVRTALLVVGVVSSSATASAQRSAADIATARDLYGKGIELRDRGDLQGALEKFRAAHALGNTPITGIELCRTHARLHQPVEAREVCLGVARIPPTSQETPRSDEARRAAATIAEDVKREIAGVKLEITGVPAGSEVVATVDNVVVPALAMTEIRAIDPGAHVVVAHVGSGRETRASFEVGDGEVKNVALVVEAPAVVAPPLAALPTTSRPVTQPRRNGVAIGGFVVAGTLTALGALGGIVAIADKAVLDDKCIDKQCGRDQHGTLDGAKTWGTVSTVSFVGAAIALGIGVIAIVARPSRASSAQIPPRLGFRSSGLDGSF